MTIYHWFCKLSDAGIFSALWEISLRNLFEYNKLHLQHQSIDSAHHKAPSGGDKTGKSPVDRRKLGTKIVVQVDQQGTPLGLSIAASNRNDQQLLRATFMETIQRIKRQSDFQFLHADKGLDASQNKRFLMQRFGIRQISPPRHYKKQKNIPVEFVKDRFRWVAERTFSWINRFRRVFILYERKAIRYESFIQLACQMICFAKL